MVKRTRLIIGTKTDLEGTAKNLDKLIRSLPKEKVLGVSVYTREGLKDLEIIFQKIIGD